MQFMRNIDKITVSFLVAILFFSRIATSEELELYGLNFPPFQIEFPENDLKGFDVEVVTEVFERAGIDVEVRFLPWKRVIAVAKKGVIAGMVSCSYQKEREEYLLFSDEISKSRRSFATVVGNVLGPMNTFEDAKGKMIVVTSGHGTEKELVKKDVVHESSFTDQASIKMLINGRVDAFYSSRELMQFLAKEMGVSDKLEYHDVSSKSVHLCLTKKWQGADALMSKFNKTLKEVKADGTYEAIHSKYK